MQFIKHINTKYFAFLFVITLWCTLFFALPDFIDNPIDNFRGYFSIVMWLVIIYFAVLPLMMLITASRYISAISIPIFGILGSVIAYYRFAYHATVTVVMIDSVLNTTSAEASSVITPGLFVYILINILISVIFVILRYRIGKLKITLPIALCGAIGLFAIYNINESIKYSIVQHYPHNVYFYGKEYYNFVIKRSQPREMMPVKKISETPDSLTVIFVLGESMRADHMSFNNYSKETTPLLKSQNNFVSMGDVWNPYTNTGSAVPYILTPAKQDKKDWAHTKESFIPYYKAKGFYTFWLSNQDMGNGYSHFILSADKKEFVNTKHSAWTFEQWTDQDLIEPLKKHLAINNNRELIIIHTIGAHWYYNLHYPKHFEKFKPVTTSRVVTTNSPEEIINSYDNCVIFMDFFVNTIISMLSNHNAILIYQSDHGEALGEDGKWLHATDGDIMHHTAGFIWYSDKYKRLYPDNVKYIKQMSKKKNDAEYVFPFMLYLIGLSPID